MAKNNETILYREVQHFRQIWLSGEVDLIIRTEPRATLRLGSAILNGYYVKDSTIPLGCPQY